MALSKTVCGLLAACLWAGSGCSDTGDDDVVIGGNTLMDASVGDLDAAVPDSGLDAGLFDAAGHAGTSPLISFFVTSDKSMTGNLGGLAGADLRCQKLAAAVGAGAKTWRAFLSVEKDLASGNAAVEARSRIGKGPWYNAKGVLLANNVAQLFSLSGDHTLFVDEHGDAINGQWLGSPTPNEHDVLTGTEPDGGVAVGRTCADWTSAAPAPAVAVVGHTDGLGPNQNPAPPYNSWYSVHETAGCNDTAPRGGAGRLYCFAAE